MESVLLHQVSTGCWLHFQRPQHILVAHRLDQVLPALHELETLVGSRGLHAAGFLSYQASPVFDSAPILPAFRCCGSACIPRRRSLPLHLPLETPHRIDPADPFLYHKTTHRQTYQDALDACPGSDDILLWNDRRQLTESTIANLVVRLDSELLTPPVVAPTSS